MELEVHKSALRAAPVRERPEAGIGLVASPIEIDRPVASAPTAANLSAFPSEDWSTLNEASLARQLRRAVRTRAPFLVADLLALVLSSLAAQGLMWVIYPPAGQILGPMAPVALFRPVILTDPAHTCRTSIIPVVNDEETLESILRVRGIRHAVVSLPAFSIGRLTEVLDRYSGLVPHLLVLSDASTLPTLWGASRSFGRLSGIEVRNGLLLA